VGVALGYWVFRSYVSIVMVSFTAIAAIPFVHNALKSEEEKKVKLPHANLLQKHWQIVVMFTFLFIGYVTTFVTLFVLLPDQMVEQIFQAQVGAITHVQNTVTGNFLNLAQSIGLILLNNVKVLILCIVFSLAYGAGAVYIFAWNASVMGAAIGEAIRIGIRDNTSTALQIVSSNLAGYFVHGIPEMIAYFTAGIAGGILSMAVVKEGFSHLKLKKSWKDPLYLVGFALAILILAALLEVFISPMLR
ncbi:MAG: stage II sporulation protein M, partial [Nanoarchaeota archaeon]|nr:stage II sporulation protein M [Nanoarchaeota archaeon]